MPAVGSQEVLLASPAVLAQLLSLWPASTSGKAGQADLKPKTTLPQASRSRPARFPLLAETRRTPRSPLRICSCGACSRCWDNARWNRIFDEKFADPSYYGDIVVRHESSLAGIYGNGTGR
jgi:hypothetical protein